MCGFQRVADRVPHPGETGGIWAAFQEGGKLTKAKQEKEPETMPPPALPLLPAVRAVSGFSQRGQSGGWKALLDPMMGESPAVARVLSGDLTKKGVVLLKSESRKTKKGFWISEDLDEKVDIYLRLDNCASRSEFMENALRFYIGYLNTKNAGGFLPEALSAMLTGTLDNFAGRMGSLLFKQGVDLNVLGQIIAYDTDIDEGEYQRLRGRAIRDMKRTNGRISFKDALDFQKSV